MSKHTVCMKVGDEGHSGSGLEKTAGLGNEIEPPGLVLERNFFLGWSGEKQAALETAVFITVLGYPGVDRPWWDRPLSLCAISEQCDGSCAACCLHLSLLVTHLIFQLLFFKALGPLKLGLAKEEL